MARNHYFLHVPMEWMNRNHHHQLLHHWLQKTTYSHNDLQIGHNKKFKLYLCYTIQIPKTNPFNLSAFLKNCIKVLWLLIWCLSTDYHNRGNLVLFNSTNQSVFKTDDYKQQILWYSQLKPTQNVNIMFKKVANLEHNTEQVITQGRKRH
jgi:hypothetical protein